MATSSVVGSSLKVDLSATPNNYGVTHIAIGSTPKNVAWKKARLLRKYSGYPQNINDGDTIFEFSNTDAILKVDSVFTLKGLSVKNYSGFPDTNTEYSLNPGFSGPGVITKFVKQPDGKLLISGSFNSFKTTSAYSLIRLNADLTVDNTFSAALDTGYNNQIQTISLQSDGKILVGGFFRKPAETTTYSSLVRLNSNGSLDTAFNTNIGTGFTMPTYNGVVSTVNVQSDGKILVGGNFELFNGVSAKYFTRLNSDGTLDTAFNTALGTTFIGHVQSSALQSDGKILVGSGVTKGLIRLNSNGSLDTAFNTALGTGFVAGTIKAITIQSDEKILVGGLFSFFQGNYATGLYRLNADGTSDIAFKNSLGTGLDASGLSVNSIALQPDGKILVGGVIETFNGIAVAKNFTRLNSDGTLDTNFNTNLGAGFSGTVNTIYVNDNENFYIGGSFIVSRNEISTTSLVSNIGSYVPSSNIVGLADSSGIGTSLGKDAKFSVSSTGITVSPDYRGTGYAVNDLVAAHTNVLSGLIETAQPNEYGLSGVYHAYDIAGTNTAVTTNPGLTTASEVAQESLPKKAYYALFIQYAPTYTASQINTGFQWSKVGETSSILVKDTGTVDALTSHLPAFYLRDSETSVGNDLRDFLKVFAFQLDVYKTNSANVFYNTDITTADETLLNLLLKEFGVPFANVGDVAQARTLAANIIKIYKDSGSLLGLETLIEAYTGYGSEITVGRNLLQDYNSSSFEENTGFWFPVKDFTTHSPSLTSVGPVDNNVMSFSDSAAGYGKLNVSVTSASCLTSSTTVTGTFDATLKVGSVLAVVGGTGVLSNGTVITSILSTNTFRINYPPTTALSGASLRASSNMVTGMGKVVVGTTVATTASFYLGPKKANTTASATSTTAISVTPYIVEANDYVIGETIPYGTYVVSTAASSATSQNIVLSTTTTLTSGSTLTFSRNAAEKIGAQASWLTVAPDKPYTFSMFFNSGSSITGTAVATASVAITWRDRTGKVINNVNGINSSTTVSVAAGTTNKWVPAISQGVSPSNALYAEPKFSITNITSTSSWYVDAAQFEGPINVVKKEIPTATTVKITTETEHYFNSTRYGLSGANYVTVTGLGYPYDGDFPIAAIDTPTSVTYTISATSVASETSVIGGLVASNSPYEDARKTIVDVLSNRINLVTNPSFEVDTYFWGNASTASTSAGVNCAIATSTAQVNFGFSALRLTSSTAAPMSVQGYAGTIVSGIITNYKTPFSVDRSTSTEESFYTLSFYTKAASASKTCYSEIYWFKDDEGTVPSDIKIKEVGASTVNSTTEWIRNSVIGRAPEDAKTAKVEVHFVTTTSNEVHYLDNVLFEKSYSVSAYFDGSFDGQNYTDDRDSIWETGGIPNKCRSHFYLNRVANTGRLKTTLTDGLYYA
jgi:phage tail-like protein/uncharacterized delta-60 repeat protein